MKLVKVIKVAGLLGIVCILLAGCFYNTGVFNLGNWDTPNDYEFKATIEMLDHPCKISSYMMSKFTYEYYPDEAISPYELWKGKRGDCNDFSTFFSYVGNYHGYETYQIRIVRTDTDITHWIGIFTLSGRYYFTSNRAFYPWGARHTFREMVEVYCTVYKKDWVSYEVYNYDMKVIEKGDK